MSIWTKIVEISEKEHSDTSQVIISIVGAYLDKSPQAPLLPYQCPSCRKVNEPGANYCSDCGTPLNSIAAAEMLEMREYINKFKNDPDVMKEYSEWLRTRKKK